MALHARYMPDGCIEWTGYMVRGGYGMVCVDSRMVLVHRFVYEAMVGPIPADLEIDHLCRNRRCFNPTHLEPVTQVENRRRGLLPTMAPTYLDRARAVYVANARAKTHCPYGHPYDEANTYITKRGHRNCRACSRERSRLAAKRCA